MLQIYRLFLLSLSAYLYDPLSIPGWSLDQRGLLDRNSALQYSGELLLGHNLFGF